LRPQRHAKISGKICEQYGSVYHFDWIDDFAAARNYSLDKCTADWILIIDADEILVTPVKEIKKKIAKVKRDMALIFDVVMRNQEDDGMGAEVERLKSIRVIKRSDRIRWVGAIHNSLALDGDRQAMKTIAEMTSFRVDSGFSPSHEKDPERTFRILHKQLEAEPNNTRYLYYLAREYLFKKQDENEALKYLTRYYQIAFFAPWSNELADACLMLAEIYVMKKDFHRAVSYASDAVLVWPTFKAPMVLLASLFQHGMPDKTIDRVAFWEGNARRATNEKVLFLRS
jgi:glycosyltransferase involved in cell wall biosynthesis